MSLVSRDRRPNDVNSFQSLQQGNDNVHRSRCSWAAQVPHHPIVRTRMSRHAGPICQRITFRCSVEDPDTLHTNEEFTYTWRSSLLKEPLGDREVLNNVILEEGDHLVNVTVMDSGGAVGYDEITVIVVKGGGGNGRPDGGNGGAEDDDSSDFTPILIAMVVLAAIIGMILGLGLRIQETRGKIMEVEQEEE